MSRYWWSRITATPGRRQSRHDRSPVVRILQKTCCSDSYYIEIDGKPALHVLYPHPKWDSFTNYVLTLLHRMGDPLTHEDLSYQITVYLLDNFPDFWTPKS